MNKTGIAALAAAGGIAVGALVGPHVPGLAAANTTADASSELADRIAIEDMVTRYYGNVGKQDAAEDFGAFYTDTGADEEAPAAQGTFHMMISNPVIDVNGDTATAQFMWTGVMNSTIEGRPQLWEQGREYDLLVKQDGQWRIKKRTVIADSGLPERYKATYQPRMDYDIAAVE